MNHLEKQVNALMRLCTAETENDRKKVRTELRELLCGTQDPQDADSLIRQVLLELGAPENLLGHPYMVEAILLAVEDRAYINNVTFGLYPQVAAKFDTTAGRVERAMRHLVEVTFNRGDWKVLRKYFGNTISPDKGKPTNSEFVARVANIVKQELREADGNFVGHLK